MLTIHNRAKTVIRCNYDNETEDFKRGAYLALELVKIGIEKHTFFNEAIKNKALVKENRELKSRIQQLTKKHKTKEHLVGGGPLDSLECFQVDTVFGDSFEIVANMDEETMVACTINLNARVEAKSSAELKSKLLNYINSKNGYGYVAYKNWSQAKKEWSKR